MWLCRCTKEESLIPLNDNRLQTAWRPCRLQPCDSGGVLLDARPFRTPTHRLRSLTHPSFHHTELFAQAADLRTKGADIAHVDDAMRRNARLRSARLPLKWHRDHITRPTLVIHGDGMLCPHFLEFAARRVRGESVSVSHIPETKTLPHVEKPEDFVASLLTFVG